MSYPASQLTLASALANANSAAAKAKSLATLYRNASAAGEVQRQAILDFMRVLFDVVAQWDAATALSGIGAYAQSQFGDPSLDVAAEFPTMRAAAIDLRDWIQASFPKDSASGAYLTRTYDANGTPVELTFTTAQLATFRAKCDALIATIG